MDISFQPKSTMPEEVKTGPSLKEILQGIVGLYVGPEKSIITLVLTIALVLVLAGIGAMSITLSSLEAKDAEKTQALATQDSLVAKIPIGDVKNLSNRLKVIEKIVKGQPFPTTFLKALEYVIEDDVVFEKANLSYIQTFDNYSLDLDANGPSYKSLFNQREAFTLPPYNKFFLDPKLGSIIVSKTGRITFKISSKINIRGMAPEKAEAILSKAISPDAGAASSVGASTEKNVATTTKP